MPDPRVGAAKDAAKQEAQRKEEEKRKAQQEAANNRTAASILGLEKTPAKRDKDQDDGNVGYLGVGDSEKRYPQYPPGTYECLEGEERWRQVGKRDEYNKDKKAKYIVTMDQQGKVTSLLGGVEASIDFLIKTQGATSVVLTYSGQPPYSNGMEATHNFKKYVEAGLRKLAKHGVGGEFDDNLKAATIHYYGVSEANKIFQLVRTLKVNSKRNDILMEFSAPTEELDKQIEDFQKNESNRRLTKDEVGNKIDERMIEITDNERRKIQEEARAKGIAADATKIEKAVMDAQIDLINKEQNELKERFDKANGPLKTMGDLFKNLDKINPADIVKARKEVDSYFTSSVISFFKGMMGTKEDFGTKESEARKISDRIDKRQDKRGELLDEVDKELVDLKKRAQVWQEKIDGLLAVPGLPMEKQVELQKLKAEYKKIEDGITTGSKPGLDQLRSYNDHAKDNFVKKHATTAASSSSRRPY